MLRINASIRAARTLWEIAQRTLAADQTNRRSFPPNHTFDDPFQCSHPLEQEEAEGNDDDVGADGDDDDAAESKMDQGGEDKGKGGTSQQVTQNSTF